jgi:hypothetical protein
MIVSHAEIKVLWELYNWKSIILLFWLGSRHQVHEALKFLYSESCPIKLLKAQYHTCGIAALSSSIAALISITSITAFTDKVHWLCHASWIFSVFSAFLSAALACRHTRYIGNILLEDEDNVWEFKKWIHSGSKACTARPLLSVVLLLSGAEMFFDTSVIAYTVGLGFYLGCVWQQNLDSSQDGSRNIFILYLVSSIFCFCIYFSLRSDPRTRKSNEWAKFLGKIEQAQPPFLCALKLHLPEGEMICTNPELDVHKHPGPLQEPPPYRCVVRQHKPLVRGAAAVQSC